jgi:hypothetical protein
LIHLNSSLVIRAAETVEFLAKALGQGAGARGDLIWLVPEK